MVDSLFDMKELTVPIIDTYSILIRIHVIINIHWYDQKFFYRSTVPYKVTV